MLEAKTVESNSFIATGNEWEKIQDVDLIAWKAKKLLDDFR